MRQSIEQKVFLLPSDERLRLAHKLLESVIDEEDDDFELTAEQKRELDRRMRDCKAHPERMIPWETVKADLDRRLDAIKKHPERGSSWQDVKRRLKRKNGKVKTSAK